MSITKRLMASWLTRWSARLLREPADTSPGAVVIDSAQKARADTGEYRLLHKYLRERYANRVVLTFGEIEDLLGFALPAPARVQREWWGVTESVDPQSAQSDAWTFASRTATVNLSAQSVVFERHTAFHHQRLAV
jgi:hypothetical protein